MAESSKKSDEISIAYTTEYLVEILKQHQLNPSTVFAKLNADIVGLTKLQNKYQENHFLFDLCEAIKNWSSDSTAARFTNNLNQLTFFWLNAFHHHAEIDSILNILNCFTLNQFALFSQSTKFHLFIHHLFIDSLNQYHTVAFDNAVNYDKNSQLPHTHQLEFQLNTILNQSDIIQKIALFSLQFQVESTAFLLPKSTSQDLNKQLAQILQKNIGANSDLYFNGDYKFDLLVTQIENATQINLLIAKIFRAFEELVFINKQSILVKPFIGYSCADSDQLSASEFYRQAKSALEHTIIIQKPYYVYSDALEQILHNQIILESKILEAFDNNNLMLNLQPIMDLKSNKCVGAELLLRGTDSSGTALSPVSIIEVLNNAGKGKSLTRWLINTAFRNLHEIRKTHQLDIYLTVNLRAEDLHDPELLALFSNALSLWQIEPNNMIIEITESGILENNDQTSAVINGLALLGFKFALDDFGTGLSSLARLRTLPIHLIKIDQSFVKDIANSSQDYEIVQSISMLAKSLGKEVVAEGVEDAECLNLLKKLKIDKCQGYFYSKALPYETFIAWAQAH